MPGVKNNGKVLDLITVRVGHGFRLRTGAQADAFGFTNDQARFFPDLPDDAAGDILSFFQSARDEPPMAVVLAADQQDFTGLIFQDDPGRRVDDNSVAYQVPEGLNIVCH